MNRYLNSPTENIAAESNLNCFSDIYGFPARKRIISWLWIILLIVFVIMFLPWTQNIRASGTVTTLRQEQRPQELNTIIAGRIVKWYVKEGDFVSTGDTIMQLGEVKAEYFDTLLLQRTKEQIEAKQQSLKSYQGKASTSDVQSSALSQAREFKLQSLENKIAQQQLKIKTDEMDLEAANNELNTYKRQIDAARIMLDSGVISLTDFEKRRVNYQNGLAKANGAANKLQQSKQELTNLSIEKESVIREYTDKLAKTSGERFSSLSEAAGTEAELLKLRNQLANYNIRNKLYFIIAPQSGQVTSAKKAGIGEFVKEGETIAAIVPDTVDYAVELFINPVDLPLVNEGQKVRFMFDGFPAIVFSGWPRGSYGMFDGKVVAIEKSVSTNGKFRALVSQDPNSKPWPTELRIGAGAKGILLLKDVRIFYELWRNINGFPPEFYVAGNKESGK